MTYKKVSLSDLKNHGKRVNGVLHLNQGVCTKDYNSLSIENELFLKVKNNYKIKDPEYYYENWR